MASDLRFDGRVALVTGAGNGLGKEYALMFAERGAKVVVNDLGGGIDGGGQSTRAAQKVVDEIKAKGGVAVPNFDSVEDGEKLVQTALDNFGRIDIVVNNAGILRDRSFARISDLDWDLVNRVHVRGAFKVCRAAWPHMKKQNYGRIINTTSSSGIYGNFGQANYSSAKMGLYGLSNTLAIEGKKNSIQVNTIAPMAGSRMTQTVMPPEMVEALKPQYIAPLTVFLCHESCEENGGLFEVGAGWIAKLRWQRTKGGVARRKGVIMRPEDVRDKWDEICDFTNHTFPTQGDTGMTVHSVLQEIEEGSSSSAPPSAVATGPEAAIGFKLPLSSYTYTDKEVILYALGVGVSTKQPDHLKFLFELSDDFCVLPTFGVVARKGLEAPKNDTQMGFPGFRFDMRQILHGEQYLEIYKPFPTSGTLTTEGVITDILDKGKGALILMDSITRDENGDKVCFNQFATFVQKAGGWGGKRSSDKAYNPIDPPKRAPDASISEKTTIDQAAIYRLSGDRNPLHIEPNFAAMGGFDKPILHGLASFGFAARHVLQQYCSNDVTKFKAIKVRFSGPVLPGQTIQTDMWKEGNRVYLQCKVAETGRPCLSGAYVDLHDGAVASEAVGSPAAGPELQSDVIFEEIKNRVASNPGLVKNVKGVFAWNITQGGKTVKQWTTDLKNGAGSVYSGEPKGKADVTLTLSDENFIALAMGKLNGQQAFMSGKLKIKGNLMLSQKLSSLFQEQSKL